MKQYLKFAGWFMKNIWYIVFLGILIYLFPAYVLPLIVGALLIYLLSWIQLKGEEIVDNIKTAERKANACQHGHEDWNDCPVCGH